MKQRFEQTGMDFLTDKTKKTNKWLEVLDRLLLVQLCSLMNVSLLHFSLFIVRLFLRTLLGKVTQEEKDRSIPQDVLGFKGKRYKK